jgi:RNA polymerase sigma-70 factor, ECF subfamily
MATRGDAVAIERMEAAVNATGATPAMLDERGFLDLYARTTIPLRAYVTRTLRNPTHADDIVQETYLRVLRRPLAHLSDEELRAYVFRIASNLVIDQWRSRKREVSDGVPEPEASRPDHALRLDVGRLFARLKLRDRQLVWLAHVEGADHREIAATLGLRAGSVRVLLSRARGRLARLLRDSGHVPKERT